MEKDTEKEKESEEGDSIIKDIAKSFVVIEEPLPEKANMESILEMLGRIERELIIYRRERLTRFYIILLVFILPLIGLGYLIPNFMSVISK